MGEPLDCVRQQQGNLSCCRFTFAWMNTDIGLQLHPPCFEAPRCCVPHPSEDDSSVLLSNSSGRLSARSRSKHPLQSACRPAICISVNLAIELPRSNFQPIAFMLLSLGSCHGKRAVSRKKLKMRPQIAEFTLATHLRPQSSQKFESSRRWVKRPKVQPDAKQRCRRRTALQRVCQSSHTVRLIP